MHSTGTARAAIVAILFAGTLASTPAGAQAQVVTGVHAVQATETLGGSIGLGVRAGINPPVFPVDIIASGEYLFPDCGDDECSLWGGSIDANFALPFPILTPYVSGGMAYRSFQLSGADPEDSAIGPTVGVGVRFSMAFGEVRYEFADAPEQQVILRVGLLF
jgi:hypothetical protein